jgi:hypothetical protein
MTHQTTMNSATEVRDSLAIANLRHKASHYLQNIFTFSPYSAAMLASNHSAYLVIRS